MKAVMFGHDLIKAGSAEVVIAGGMESMTNAPHLLMNSRTGSVMAAGWTTWLGRPDQSL
jgi:acetyl-CoA C-acetyltransferase